MGQVAVAGCDGIHGAAGGICCVVILVALLAPQKEVLPEEWHFLEVELQ